MDNIWEEPATVVAASSRVHEPLFTYSDEETAPKQASKPPLKRARPRAQDNENMDEFAENLFRDVIESNDARSSAELEAALARRAKAGGASNELSKDGEMTKPEKVATSKPNDEGSKSKPARTIAKVDEQRLLSERGIPALIKEAQKFRPKGKGHESEDLNRLMSIYQFWAHNMFPKTQFRDTIDRVERVCRSRRMLINMSMWRDAARAPQEPQRDDKPDTSDEEDVPNASPKLIPITALTTATTTSAQPMTTDRVRVIEEDLWYDEEAAIAELEVLDTTKVTAPPPKPQPTTVDEDDIEDWFNTGPDEFSHQLAKISKPPDAMDIDPTPPNQRRYLSPPTTDNWDEDLFA